MRDADARAAGTVAPRALIRRAGTAVALEAQRLLGSCYGARVAVLAGPGLNGDDGRVAANWLRARGAKVTVLDATQAPSSIRDVELVIDAAYGLGCSRPYVAPEVEPEVLVLAVDLPSGVDADSGEVLGSPLRATVTLALGALKPAHVTGDATAYVGRLAFAGLGIVEGSRDGLVEDRDLTHFVTGDASDHKWRHAVEVLAGSTSMPGAAELVTRGALASGASMIRLLSRGSVAELVTLAPEIVRVSDGTVDARCRAIVAGPGLGPDAASWLRPLLVNVSAFVVLDADALQPEFVRDVAPHNGTWILTPHEAEFERLAGRTSGSDRLNATRNLAKELGCVVLLKGPLTIIAAPDGTTRIVNSGSAALATAGTGDVLAGLIAGALARGHAPLDAAAWSAHLHGRAGSCLPPYGTATDVVANVRGVLRDLSATSAAK